MSQINPRKRPNPGASPLSQAQSNTAPTFPQAQPQQWQPQLATNVAFQSSSPAQYSQAPPFSPSTATQSPPYPPPTTSQAQPFPQPSAQLTRRDAQVAVPYQQQWQVADRTNNQMSGAGWSQQDNLDQQAQLAKEEAEKKRKQIPPFVQKLSR